MKQIHIGKGELAGSPPSTTSTYYAGPVTGTPAFDNNEVFGRQVWPTDGTFTNLLITLAGAPGTGKSWTFTVRKNGVDTALSVVISDTATTGRDTTHSVAVAPGDLLSLKSVPSGTPSASGWLITVALEFTSTNTGESGYSGQTPTVNLSTSAARYQGVFRLNNGWNTTSATAGSARSVVAAAGTVTALYLLLTAAPGAAKSYTFSLYKNGTKQDGSGGTVDTRVIITGAGVTTGSATFSLSVSPGDVLTLECAPTGTPTVARASAGVRFVATTDGESQFCGCTSNVPSTSSANYTRIPSASAINWTGTDNNDTSLCLAGVTSFPCPNSRCAWIRRRGATKSYTFDLRRNAASPAGTPTVAISGTATSGADTSNSLVLSDGETFSLRVVPAGTPTAAGAQQWGFIQTVETGTAPHVEPFVWMPI